MINQTEIDNIIDSKDTQDKKIKKLANFLEKEKYSVFADFDDTLSEKNSMIYSKFKYYRFLKKDLSIQNLITNFKINKEFIKLVSRNNIGDIIIISNNDKELIKKIIKSHANDLKTKKIKITGIIGSSKKFTISNCKKKYIIPKTAHYITDINEYFTRKREARVLYIEKPNIKKYLETKIKKIGLYIKFIIKNG